MNSLQRVITALERKVPDRVPHFEFEISSYVIDSIIPGGDIYDLIEKLDLDAISSRVNQKREKIDENTYKDERGLIVKKTTQDYLEPINTVIKNLSDLNKFEFPDPHATHRLEGLRKAINKFKNKKAVITFLRDGWSEVRDLHGFSNSLIDMVDNPKLIKGILNKAVEYYTELGKISSDMGAEIAFSGDDIAGNNGLFMSPSHFKEFIYPTMKKLYENWKNFGLYIIKHSDGNLYHIMDLLIDTGLDCLHPIDPLAGMSLAKVKAEYGRRICIMGNVNCAGNLVHGTIENIIDEVKKCIEIAAPGGGYILSSSNSIPNGVKSENYLAMVAAVKEYGWY